MCGGGELMVASPESRAPAGYVLVPVHSIHFVCCVVSFLQKFHGSWGACAHTQPEGAAALSMHMCNLPSIEEEPKGGNVIESACFFYTHTDCPWNAASNAFSPLFCSVLFCCPPMAQLASPPGGTPGVKGGKPTILNLTIHCNYHYQLPINITLPSSSADTVDPGTCTSAWLKFRKFDKMRNFLLSFKTSKSYKISINTLLLSIDEICSN